MSASGDLAKRRRRDVGLVSDRRSVKDIVSFAGDFARVADADQSSALVRVVVVVTPKVSRRTRDLPSRLHQTRSNQTRRRCDRAMHRIWRSRLARGSCNG